MGYVRRKRRASWRSPHTRRVAWSWWAPSPLYCWRSRPMPSTIVSWAALTSVLNEASKTRWSLGSAQAKLGGFGQG